MHYCNKIISITVLIYRIGLLEYNCENSTSKYVKRRSYLSANFGVPFLQRQRKSTTLLRIVPDTLHCFVKRCR